MLTMKLIIWDRNWNCNACTQIPLNIKSLMQRISTISILPKWKSSQIQRMKIKTNLTEYPRTAQVSFLHIFLIHCINSPPAITTLFLKVHLLPSIIIDHECEIRNAFDSFILHMWCTYLLLHTMHNNRRKLSRQPTKKSWYSHTDAVWTS